MIRVNDGCGCTGVGLGSFLFISLLWHIIRYETKTDRVKYKGLDLLVYWHNIHDFNDMNDMNDMNNMNNINNINIDCLFGLLDCELTRPGLQICKTESVSEYIFRR